MDSCNNAILHTIENISSLHSTSADLTSKFSNALIILKEAQQASDELINCLTNQSVKNKCTLTEHLWQNFSKDDTLFITVKSTLLNNGTFWCRVWDKQQDFDTNTLDCLSTELGWLEKEISVIPTEPKPSSKPVFFYSREKQAHYRVIIEKINSSSISLRHLDLGIGEDVSLDVQFYIVPQNIITKYPFQSMLCYISKAGVSIPYEVKWKFNDLTHNQVLYAKLIDCEIRDEVPSFLLSIKSLVNDEHISNLLAKQINKADKDLQERNERSVRIAKPLTEDKENKKPLQQTPLVATVEPVKNNNKDFDHQVKEIPKPTSRSRIVSACSYETEKELPSRCNSLDSVLLSKQAKNRRKRDNDDGTKVYSDVENACDKPLQVPRKKVYDTKSTEDEKPLPTVDWIESIPIKDRQSVPKVIPNLQNLFYTSTQLRNEPWWEIELMNINKLLNSQANLQFYCFDIFKNKLEQSLPSSKLELCIRSKSVMGALEQSSGKYSQYLLLREYEVPSYSNRSSRSYPSRVLGVIGVARLDSGIPDNNNKYPVTFLSLSRFRNSIPEFEQNQGKPLGSLSLASTKKILEAMRSTLASNQRLPVFPDYFPWCGIPPLVDDLRRPSIKKQTKKKLSSRERKREKERKERKDREWEIEKEREQGYENQRDRDYQMDRERHLSLRRADFENDWVEEEWDNTKNEVVYQKNNTKTDHESQQKDAIIKKDTVTNTTNEQSSSNEVSRPFSPKDCHNTFQEEDWEKDVLNDGEIQEKSTLNSRKHVDLTQANGFYDAFGVWYPSMVAKIVTDTLNQSRLSKEILSVDVNQNYPIPQGSTDFNNNNVNGGKQIENKDNDVLPQNSNAMIGTAFRILKRPKKIPPSALSPPLVIESDEKIAKKDLVDPLPTSSCTDVKPLPQNQSAVVDPST